MEHYWDKGEMHIRELQALYDDPKPHVNTLSTLVHILEDKGFLSHKAITPKSYKYFPRLSRDDYRRGSLKTLSTSFRQVVSRRRVDTSQGREDIARRAARTDKDG